MKKTILLLGTITMLVLTVSADSCAFRKGETLYFNMSGCSDWTQSDGYPAVVFYYADDAAKDIYTNTTDFDNIPGSPRSTKIGAGNYVTMTALGNNMYSVVVPVNNVGYIRVVRISGEDPNWIWNSQNKLSAADAGINNCIEVSGWDNSGSWTTYNGGREDSCGDTPSPISDDDPEETDTMPLPQPIVGTQVYTFPTDAQQRGYYDRPYERYEAEPDWCTTDGTFLEPTDNQSLLQSEASHQQAVQLVNQNSYVSWTIHNPGDGLTVRFSLPDNAEGTGTKGNIAIYAGSDQVGTLQLDSYWAWQYCSQTYPTNNPNNGPVIRMRFDEMHLRLSRQVAQGEVLKIVKTDNNTTPYTIDFVELEPVPAKVTFESLSGNKVQYDGVTDMQDFITANPGKIIYFPEGKWVSHRRLYMTNGGGTQMIGAGMWYTEIYFDTSSDDASKYNFRGIEASSSNLRCEGIYFNTVNNQRYRNENSSQQVGKGFQGSWGSNSVISHCWVEHFECGAWIANYGSNSSNLLIEHCRFRNNYADGVNCAHGASNATVTHCSFRNNGDDDMASWSDGTLCQHNTFSYNTAENNWRASSLGFFGGKGHNAHHLYIVDALESGARTTCDFNGNAFDQTERMSIHDVTIQHCGCKGGARGYSGDFWGSAQGAVDITSYSNYSLFNVSWHNISIYDSRSYAFLISSNGSRTISNVELKNIAINKASYGVYLSGSTRGSITYCNITYANCTTNISTIPGNLSWTPMTDCSTPTQEVLMTAPAIARGRFFQKGRLFIRVGEETYDVFGRKIH